jgi:hypothetical protein
MNFVMQQNFMVGTGKQIVMMPERRGQTASEKPGGLGEKFCVWVSLEF